MPKAKTNLDFQALNKSLKQLQTSLPNDSEISKTFLSTVDSITKLTKGHDELISKYYKNFEVSSGTEAGNMKVINQAYSNLVNGLQTTVNQSGIDQSGSGQVNNQSGSGNTKSSSTSGGGGSSSSSQSNGGGSSSGNSGTTTSTQPVNVQSGGISSGSVSKTTVNNKSNKSTATSYNAKTTKKKTTKKSSATPSATIEAQTTIPTKTGSSLPRTISSAAASIGSAVKIPLPSVKDTNYKDKITLSSAVGGTVIGNTISKITEGNNSESRDYQVDSNFWTNMEPSEKDVIVSKLEEVGFSPDEVQEILHDKITVPEDVLDSAYNVLSEQVNKDKEIRNILKNNYGFDLFDDETTINKDKLSLALIIDKKNASDAYDLNRTLNITNSANTEDSLLENVIKPSSKLDIPVKNSSLPTATIASLMLGALGISGGGAAIAVKHKKKKQQNDTEITDENENE